MDLLSNSGELITPPQCGGIVEFRVEGHQFERLNGTCNIVLIEKTSNLRAYFNNFVTKRVMRWLDAEGFGFSCRWRSLISPAARDSATLGNALKWRLKRYLAEHWEPPSGHDESGGTDPESAIWIEPKKRELAVMPCLTRTLGEGFTDWSEWYVCRNIPNLAIPTIPGKPNGSWSTWEHLGCPRCTDQKPLIMSNPISTLVPSDPGIYEIRLNREFGRVRGKTDIVNIGVATVSLRERVFEQKAIRWKRNWSGSMKWIKENDPNFIFEARWLSMKGCSDVQIPAAENWRIAEFNLKHYEQPPGQTRPPSGWSKK